MRGGDPEAAPFDALLPFNAPKIKPKVWMIRKWRSMPRFLKLYFAVVLFVAMLLLFFVALTGTGLSFTSFSSSTTTILPPPVFEPRKAEADDWKHPIVENADVKSGVHTKEDVHQKEAPNPLPKPGHNKPGEDSKSEDEIIDEVFKFNLKNDKEIVWERDLKAQKRTMRQEEVVKAMRHSWDAYHKYAWGSDHLTPISKGKQNWFHVGLTIIDSMDTLLFMGMEKEFNDALTWVERDLSFDINKDVNCFEMTIRVLGGLLSAFHLTKKPVLLAKAVDVGDRLIHCFDSPSNKVPYSDVNLKTRHPKSPSWSPDSSLSEVSSVQLEFRDLSRLIREDKMEKISFRTSQHIHNLTLETGDPLLSMYINPLNGRFTPTTITLGARADSYYEYLLKQYLQTGILWLRDDYQRAVEAISNRLVKQTEGPLKLTYIAELLRRSTDINPKMDHLVCFLSGTLATGYYHYQRNRPSYRGLNSFADNAANEDIADETGSQWPEAFASHLPLAEALARTCYTMYNSTATGLASEIVYFGLNRDEEEIYIRPADSHNLLRPEYVESLFYLYHVTENEMYREQGWKIFNSFNQYSKVPSGGYTTINDVRNPSHPRPRNLQESYWLAETLKYFYLLFSDDKQLISKLLNYYVFNTEGHVIPLNKGHK